MKSNFHINQMKYKVNSGYSRYVPHIGEYDMWRFTDIVIDDNGISGKYEVHDVRSARIREAIAQGRVHIGVQRKKASHSDGQQWFIYPVEFWTVDFSGGEFHLGKPPIFPKNTRTAEYNGETPHMDVRLVVFVSNYDNVGQFYKFYTVPNSLTRLYY